MQSYKYPVNINANIPKFGEELELKYYLESLERTIHSRLAQTSSRQDEQKTAIQNINQLFKMLFDQNRFQAILQIDVENSDRIIVYGVMLCLNLNPVPWRGLLSLLIDYPDSFKSNIFSQNVKMDNESQTAAYWLIKFALKAHNRLMTNPATDDNARSLGISYFQYFIAVVNLRWLGRNVREYANINQKTAPLSTAFSSQQATLSIDKDNLPPIIDLRTPSPTHVARQTPEAPGSAEQMLASDTPDMQHNDADPNKFNDMVDNQSSWNPHDLQSGDKPPTQNNSPSQWDTSPDISCNNPERFFSNENGTLDDCSLLSLDDFLMTSQCRYPSFCPIQTSETPHSM
jgi:hypothetical protein